MVWQSVKIESFGVSFDISFLKLNPFGSSIKSTFYYSSFHFLVHKFPENVNMI